MNVDEALREYVNHPTPPGLEARVMRRIQRPRWLWIAPAPAAAALVALFCLPKPATLPSPAQILPSRAREEAVARAQSNVPRKPSRHRETAAHALWRVAQVHPEVADPYEPAPIEPLEIKPITIEELGNQ